MCIGSFPTVEREMILMNGFEEAGNYFVMENRNMPEVWLFFQYFFRLPQNSTIDILPKINKTLKRHLPLEQNSFMLR